MEIEFVKTADLQWKAKYHPITDITEFQGVGVKFSNTTPKNFRVFRTELVAVRKSSRLTIVPRTCLTYCGPPSGFNNSHLIAQTPRKCRKLDIYRLSGIIKTENQSFLLVVNHINNTAFSLPEPA
jgi:hypothetical protein